MQIQSDSIKYKEISDEYVPSWECELQSQPLYQNTEMIFFLWSFVPSASFYWL